MTNSDQHVSESLIEVSLTCGVQILVCTLTPLAVHNLSIESENRYPLPDEKDYETPIDNALPGTTANRPAKDNPDYIAAVNTAYFARAAWLLDAIADIVIVSAHDEAAVVERYAERLAKLRRHGAVEEREGDTPFTLVLRHFLLHDVRDANLILQAAQLYAPLSASEVADGRKLFRVEAARDRQRNSVIQPITRGLTRGTQRKSEPPTVRDTDSA